MIILKLKSHHDTPLFFDTLPWLLLLLTKMNKQSNRQNTPKLKNPQSSTWSGLHDRISHCFPHWRHHSHSHPHVISPPSLYPPRAFALAASVWKSPPMGYALSSIALPLGFSSPFLLAAFPDYPVYNSSSQILLPSFPILFFLTALTSIWQTVSFLYFFKHLFLLVFPLPVDCKLY